MRLHSPTPPYQHSAAVTSARHSLSGDSNPFGFKPWRDKRSYEVYTVKSAVKCFLLRQQQDMFEILEADIVVLQELKIQRKDLKDDMVLVPGWDCFFSLPKHKKGRLLGLEYG